MNSIKKRILLSLVLVASVNSYAQTWCPLGATWYYGGNSLGFSGYHKLTYVHDTTINSNSCKMIIDHLEGNGYNGYFNADIDTLYTYEQNGVVYMYNNKYGNNRYDTLFNINANIGDEWRMPRADTTCDSINIQVLDTGINTINGHNLKWLCVKYPGFGISPDTIIEGIGFMKIFFYFPMICHAMDERSFGGLRCYSDSILGAYSTGITPVCDFYYTGISEWYKDEYIKLYPTIIDKYVNIKIDVLARLQGSFMLFDMAGRNILCEKIDMAQSVNTFNIESVSSGIYNYKIDVDNKYFKIGKLIIIK